MNYEYKHLTLEALKKYQVHLNEKYKSAPIWAAMIKKMADLGWRFVQYTPYFNMRRPGPYGCFTFERAKSKGKKNSSILNDSGNFPDS